jgi:hypothetical protein
LELGNRGRDLESLVEDDLLSLESDVCGPLDESGQVSLGGDVPTCKRGQRGRPTCREKKRLTDTEGSASLLEKRVLGGLGGLLGAV